MSDDQVTVTPEQLDGLASTLDGSLDALRGLRPPADGVDAGISTSAVTETLATIYQAVAVMVADTEKQAVQVRDSGGEYTRSDEQAASEFPPWLAVPSNLDGGR